MVHRSRELPPGERPLEVVERKGLGHPDSICDALAEELSLAIGRCALDLVGHAVHHNVDKALLVAGSSAPRFGGGRVLEPMRILLAGRATLELEGRRIPVEQLARESARRWLEAHLHALDPVAHVAVEAWVRPGSAELVELFGRGAGRRPLSNDTSCGTGFAPLTELERVVLEVEADVTGGGGEPADPAWGEDVKVMGVRRGDAIDLTVACAFVDRAIAGPDEYAEQREQLVARVERVAAAVTRCRVHACVNAADDPAAGSFYLTVTGTSAEAGDDGQAGRGNRANGLITPGRPMTLESVAGKNPVTHVGKIYNLVASLAAERVVRELPEVRNAECTLVSRIGAPVDDPQIVELRLHTRDDRFGAELVGPAQEIVRSELERAARLPEALLSGEVRLDRWPLRAERAAR